MFDKLTTRALDKVGRLQRELDAAKAKIAALERDQLALHKLSRMNAIEECANVCMAVARSSNFEWRACEGCAEAIRGLDK